jgi:quinol monooxygenase YgiN
MDEQQKIDEIIQSLQQLQKSVIDNEGNISVEINNRLNEYVTTCLIGIYHNATTLSVVKENFKEFTEKLNSIDTEIPSQFREIVVSIDESINPIQVSPRDYGFISMYTLKERIEINKLLEQVASKSNSSTRVIIVPRWFGSRGLQRYLVQKQNTFHLVNPGQPADNSWINELNGIKISTNRYVNSFVIEFPTIISSNNTKDFGDGCFAKIQELLKDKDANGLREWHFFLHQHLPIRCEEIPIWMQALVSFDEKLESMLQNGTLPFASRTSGLSLVLSALTQNSMHVFAAALIPPLNTRIAARFVHGRALS